MTTPSPFDEIRAGLDEIEAAHRKRVSAFEDAVGIAADDIDDPSVVAGVERGKLTALVVPDDIFSLPVPEIEAIVNGLIMAAFQDWHSTYQALLNDPDYNP